VRIALTREVSRSLASCELTHVPRSPIDVERAREQHHGYEACLEELGCTILRLPEAPEHPDSVFVEDVGIVFDEIAIATRPGAVSRRGEVESVAAAVARHREVVRVEAPGTLEGGDVLRIGRTVWVGLTSRTNRDGVAQLRAVVEPRGYRVVAVPVAGCLHLKSAVTEAAEGAVLLHPGWVPAERFSSLERIEVDPSEPMAANGLRVGGTLLYPSVFPRTREKLAKRGIHMLEVDVSELQKAEGAVTCCSIVFESEGRS
jgi:dimethylargininase